MTRLSRALLRMAPQLKVSPVVSMFNDPLSITASGLEPGQRVGISAYVDHKSGRFQSEAHFEADGKGEVDCSRQAPVDGPSYRGTHAMGLLWSLTACPGQRRGLRFTPTTVDTPIHYQFSLSELSTETKDDPCASPCLVLHRQQVERRLLHPVVTRTEVEFGRIRGTLFTMKDPPRRLPGVIDMFGTGGGLMEHRAALLAAEGFAVLALAFFDYKDLPKGLFDLDLEYFQEAVDWLLSHPLVMSHGCAAIGTSLGGDIVVRMGIHFPEVKFAVPINGFHMLDNFNPIKYQGKPLPTFSGDISKVDIINEVLYYAPWRARIPTEDHLVHPVELSTPDTRFLFLVSESDDCNPTLHAATKLKERFERYDRLHQFEMLSLPGAGHLLEPPYTPHCPYSWHKLIGMQISTGGDAVSHNAAQEKMWPILKQRLAEHVGKPPSVPAISESIVLEKGLRSKV